MKTRTFTKIALLLAGLVLAAANGIGIAALAAGEGDGIAVISTDDPPPGVLKGYMPVTERVKTGEHFEYYGWAGAPFARLVSEYSEIRCCRKTYRAMDGCKDLPICQSES